MENGARPNIIHVRVSDDEKRFLEQVAREDDRNISAVLRVALKEFYERRMENQA
jgi:predicted transcriptional regulator